MLKSKEVPMNVDGRKKTDVQFKSEKMKSISALVLILVCGFYITAFADETPIKLDNIKLAVEVKKFDDVVVHNRTTEDLDHVVTFHGSVKIDKDVTEDFAFIWLWYVSNQPGFVPNAHTLYCSVFTDKNMADEDENGDLVLHVPYTVNEGMIPGVKYYARAQIVLARENELYFRGDEPVKFSQKSDFSEEASFVLPAERELRGDVNYFLIDKYYSASADGYELVKENREDVLYLPVTSEINDEHIRKLLHKLNIENSATRPLPDVGDVVLFEPHRNKRPMEVVSIEKTDNDRLRVSVKQFTYFHTCWKTRR